MSNQVFCFNSSNCDFSLAPIIAIGTEVTDEKYADLNCIPAFRLSTDGLIENILTEDEADSISNPIYIVTEISDDFKTLKIEEEVLNVGVEYSHSYENLSSSPNKKGIVTTPTDYYIVLTGGDIYARYESDDYSEVRLMFVYDKNGTRYMGPKESVTLWSVYRNQIPITIIDEYWIRYFENNQTQPMPVTNDYTLYAVLFERDWFCTRKDVYVGGTTLKCYMRNSGDWYSKGSFEVSETDWTVGSIRWLLDHDDEESSQLVRFAIEP